jgi:hypothetical protein
MINSNYKKSTKGYTSKQIDNQMDEIISELCSKSKLGVFISESGLGIAQKFYDRPLASNIIYQSNVLYSKFNDITKELGYLVNCNNIISSGRILFKSWLCFNNIFR